MPRALQSVCRLCLLYTSVDSGVCVLAKRAGVVRSVSADEVRVTRDDGEIDTYHIIKFMRSNQGTCVNQVPVVSVGDRVQVGDVIADGPATKDGEISLGKNALIGFMTWEGYNYEDAVLISEKIVRDDVYTSIHIEEYETEARDTKLGPEAVSYTHLDVYKRQVLYIVFSGGSRSSFLWPHCPGGQKCI